jgi:hypothetical protein
MWMLHPGVTRCGEGGNLTKMEGEEVDRAACMRAYTVKRVSQYLRTRLHFYWTKA